jgi:hypothetical protein
MRKSVVWVCGVFLVLLSCEEPEQALVEKMGANYLPLQVGSYAIYDVDSTSILFQIETSYRFQIKHTVADSFLNAEGGYTYIVARHKRESETKPWVAAPTWHARVTGREGIIVEGNIPYVKMVFPISDGVTWNGNAQNSLGGDESCGNVSFDCDTYRAEILREVYSLPSSLSFAEIVKVVEHDSPDLITVHDVRHSVYAKGVGLVERELTYLKYCSDEDLGCIGKKLIEKGTRFKMSIKEYGQL